MSIVGLAQGWRWRENPYTYCTEGSLFVDGRRVGSVVETKQGEWKAQVLNSSKLTVWQVVYPVRDCADAVAWVEKQCAASSSAYEQETAGNRLATLRERQLKAAEQLLSLLEADPDCCPIVLGSARSVLKAVRNG